MTGQTFSFSSSYFSPCPVLSSSTNCGHLVASALALVRQARPPAPPRGAAIGGGRRDPPRMRGGLASAPRAPPWRPTTTLITVVLISANGCFAAWDIMSREIFALQKHPFPPLAFMVLRTMLSCVVAWAYARLTSGKTYRLEALPRGPVDRQCSRHLLLFVEAMLYTTVGQCLYLYGVKLAGATHAAIMQPLVPVFTMLIGVTLGIESLGTASQICGKVASVVLSVGGAVVIIVGSEGGKLPNGMSREAIGHGMIMVFVQIIAWSFFYTMQARLLRFYKPSWLTFLLFLLACPQLLLVLTGVVVVEDHGHYPMPEFNAIVVFGGLYSVFSSVVFAVATTWAAKYVPASTVTLFMCAHPLCTALFSFLAFGRVLQRSDVIGGVTLLLGFYVNNRWSGSMSGGHGPPPPPQAGSSQPPTTISGQAGTGGTKDARVLSLGNTTAEQRRYPVTWQQQEEDESLRLITAAP